MLCVRSKYSTQQNGMTASSKHITAVTTMLCVMCSRVNDRVVVDGACVTSRGPGTAFEFALMLIEKLYGAEQRDSVAGPMVMYSC